MEASMAVSVISGTVQRVFLPRGYCFVRGDDQVLYFLHATEVPEGTWDGDHIRLGVRVTFTPTKTEEGWRATGAKLCG